MMIQNIQGGGEIRDQIEKAVKATQGEDRIIIEIIDASAHLGPSFPRGTSAYAVRSESITCTHNPRCLWCDHAYHYRNRTVVLSMLDMIQTSIAQVKAELLKEEDGRISR